MSIYIQMIIKLVDTYLLIHACISASKSLTLLLRRFHLHLLLSLQIDLQTILLQVTVQHVLHCLVEFLEAHPFPFEARRVFLFVQQLEDRVFCVVRIFECTFHILVSLLLGVESFAVEEF